MLINEITREISTISTTSFHLWEGTIFNPSNFSVVGVQGGQFSMHKIQRRLIKLAIKFPAPPPPQMTSLIMKSLTLSFSWKDVGCNLNSMIMYDCECVPWERLDGFLSLLY